MNVRLYATLRPIVGGATVSVDTGPGDTFRDLIDELVLRWPEIKPELYDREGKLRNNIHIFLNGRDVRYLDGLDMPIPEDAEVRIFPPVGGGSGDLAAGNPDNTRMTHDYYGVPDWLMKDYLTSVGAVESEENFMVADGWQARVTKATPNHIGSLVIGGSTVHFSGDQAALDAMFEKLHWKTLRGGG
jgi:molybdopterin synthase sulfur carrier subunit